MLCCSQTEGERLVVATEVIEGDTVPNSGKNSVDISCSSSFLLSLFSFFLDCFHFFDLSLWTGLRGLVSIYLGVLAVLVDFTIRSGMQNKCY